MNREIKRLGSSVLTYGVGQVLMRMLSLLLLPVFTAYLTPAEYGISSILGILTYILVPVFSLGLGSATGPCYFEGNSTDRKRTTIHTAGAILLASCAVLVLTALLFDERISVLTFGSARHALLVRLTFIGACFTILATPFMQALQFEERARLYVVLTMATALATIVASILLVVVLRRGVRGMIEAGVIGQFACLMMFAAPSLSRARARVDQSLAKDLLRLGLVLVPAAGFQCLLQQSSKYMLQQSHGLAIVGIYTIGWTLGMGMAILVNAFGNAWYAYFMRFADDHEAARLYFPRLTTTYVLVFGCVSLMFFVFARPAVMLLTGPAYADACWIVGFAATAQLFNGLYLMLLPGLYFARKVKYVTLVQGIASVVALGLNVVFIRRWGLVGAGAALALSHFVLVVVQYGCNRITRHLEIEYQWRRLGMFALLYAAVAAAGMWPRNLSLGTELLASFAAAVVLVAAVHSLFTDEEKRFVAGLLRRPPPAAGRELPPEVISYPAQP